MPIHQPTWALYSASHLRRGQFLHLQILHAKKNRKNSHYFNCILLLLTRNCAFRVLSLVAQLFLVLRYREEGSAFVLNFGRKLAVFVHSFHRLGSFVEPKSMGAQISKTAGKEDVAAEKPAEGAAVEAKANGQGNGHAKTNGDASPATEEAVVQANGTTPVEDAPKDGEEKIEAVEANGEGKEPTATNGEAKAEDGATPSGSEDAKQKKKRFSFKKPNFKLSGFSFKKTKKDSEEATGEEGAAAEPATGEEKPAEEGGAAASEEVKPEEAAKEEAKEPAAAAAVVAPAEEPKAEQVKAEGEVAAAAAAPAVEEKPTEASPAEPETAASPEAPAAAE